MEITIDKVYKEAVALPLSERAELIDKNNFQF